MKAVRFYELLADWNYGVVFFFKHEASTVVLTATRMNEYSPACLRNVSSANWQVCKLLFSRIVLSTIWQVRKNSSYHLAVCHTYENA